MSEAKGSQGQSSLRLLPLNFGRKHVARLHVLRRQGTILSDKDASLLEQLGPPLGLENAGPHSGGRSMATPSRVSTPYPAVFCTLPWLGARVLGPTPARPFFPRRESERPTTRRLAAERPPPQRVSEYPDVFGPTTSAGWASGAAGSGGVRASAMPECDPPCRTPFILGSPPASRHRAAFAGAEAAEGGAGRGEGEGAEKTQTPEGRGGGVPAQDGRRNADGMEDARDLQGRKKRWVGGMRAADHGDRELGEGNRGSGSRELGERNDGGGPRVWHVDVVKERGMRIAMKRRQDRRRAAEKARRIVLGGNERGFGSQGTQRAQKRRTSPDGGMIRKGGTAGEVTPHLDQFLPEQNVSVPGTWDTIG